jgi:hypothetical protein
MRAVIGNVICFVPNQHAELDLNSTHWNNSSQVEMWLHLDTLSLIRSNQSLFKWLLVIVSKTEWIPVVSWVIVFFNDNENEKLVNHIMTGTCYIRWADNDIDFVPIFRVQGQWNDSQSMGRYVAPLRYIILIPSQPVFDVCL